MRHFGAAEDRRCFTAEEWDSNTLSADQALVRLLEEHPTTLTRRIARPPPPSATRCKAAIVATLLEGGSAECVARALSVSVRTLQRKLGAAGTTFRELSDAVRKRLAQGYLGDPSVGRRYHM